MDGSTPLKNPRRESFARYYVELGDGAKAYRMAGYAAKNAQVASASSARLMANPTVRARVDYLMAEVGKRHDVTVDSIIAELEQARERAMRQDPTTSAAVQAIIGKAKIAGLIVDRTKAEATVRVQNLPPLSPEAAAALLERIEAERF